jgi:dihydrofolate reductase
MRSVILQLAVSLDGFIEGLNGEFDWCFTDADYGMTAFSNRIDTIFIGRKSYELTLTMGGAAPPGFPAVKEYVFSNSLSKLEGDRILVRDDLFKEVNKIKNVPGKDIWLYGGASLTSTFIDLGLVDEMALAVHLILLGAGKPLFENIKDRKHLQLINAESYPSGLVMLSYKFQSTK